MRRRRPFLRLEIRLRARNVAAADLLADLRSVARRQRSHALTMRVYNAAGRYRAGTLVRRFGSWTGALKAARLPVQRRWRIPESVLLANLGQVWRRLGRQPTWRDLTLHDGRSRFAGSTYKARFGSWHKALVAFERYARDKRPLSASRDRSAKPTRSRGPRDVGWRLRARVLIRDNCLCRMCGASPAKDPAVTLHVDHVVPWSKGGQTVMENLRTLCERCNIGKGAQRLSSRSLNDS
jgi:5-methylcytosine-specific restriction endonuclease McrA